MTTYFGPKLQFSVQLNLYLKTTCSIRPHFYDPMDGVQIQGGIAVLVQGTEHHTEHKQKPS